MSPFHYTVHCERCGELDTYSSRLWANHDAKLHEAHHKVFASPVCIVRVKRIRTTEVIILGTGEGNHG